MRKQFDFVLLDCPPMGIVTDYDLIQTTSDGTVLITRPGHTNRKLLDKGLQQVPNGKLIGVVLNCIEDWFLWKTQDDSYARYIGTHA
jgi:Mrp family chromosome partitioning ATPase